MAGTPLRGAPLPPAPYATLVEALDALSSSDDPWLVSHLGSSSSTLSGRAVHDLVRRWAGAWRSAGVRPGDRVLVLLPNGPRFLGALFGAMWMGAVPVPMAWPFSLGNKPRALELLRPLAEAADAAAIATTPELASLSGWAIPAVFEPGEPLLPAAVGALDPAFVQFTSGSLGRPRGVVLSHRACVASAWAMGRALDLGPADVGVSWLPMFHDMGLVGAVFCPLLNGFPLHIMEPAEFLLHPTRWVKRISEARGTIGAAPDFAWDLLSRRVRDVEAMDLTSWRHPLSGAEPVHRATLEAVAKRLAPAGFRPAGPKPVYGLAENTLGVCFSDDTDAEDLPWEGRQVPSVGRPLPGLEVAVHGTRDGEQGEIVVRGPTLMSGYFRDEASTEAALRDGWLHTGDLGVIRGGRLYVTGREKDLVIHHGRKLHPYDIERIAAIAVDAPPNGAAAFAIPHATGEDLVVVVEQRGSLSAAEVEQRVRTDVMEALGIRADRVIGVGIGALPRTTSGKVRRRECAVRFGGGP